MQWKLFADLAETAGTRTVSLDADCDTVGDALDTLLSSRPALEARVLDDDGDVRDHINVLRNGENVFTGEGLDTPVDADDELALFPPVSGG
ncbi:molybdopterin synthase sulfur carrier subunit [Haloprofundus marisrubri]|uniref:Molybdopterin synthase sulfur carrier subunit n=1 Tax=Haloprofundus marisrubri TaxID=1514971 RepID=A0A0W1R875_9EURY|nr:ubiquitin-like small modifier protein 1 [Haloprofundus marisrubri]KTG09565.1 molybdopterin synthase sulfur carrier subunit [Haloprofundus marisrubri]